MPALLRVWRYLLLLWLGSDHRCSGAKKGEAPAGGAAAEYQIGSRILMRHQSGIAISKAGWRSAEGAFSRCAGARAVPRELLVSCLYGLGICRASLKEHRLAVDAYDAVLEVSPDHEGASIQRAGQLVALGKRAAAIAGFRHALKLYSKQHFSVLYQFAVLLTVEHGNEREKLLRDVLRLKPDHQGAYSALIMHLQCSNRQRKAQSLLKQAMSRGIFPNRWQHQPQPFIKGLLSKPFWMGNEYPELRSVLDLMHKSWRQVAVEYKSRSDWFSLLPPIAGIEGLADPSKGAWRGGNIIQMSNNLNSCLPEMPASCQLLRDISKVAKGFRLLDADLSVLEGSGHIRPHCGPHNKRLTFHLPLDVPNDSRSMIRVADMRKGFVDGEPLIFDDSFEHEVWNEGDTFRAILILTFDHPGMKLGHQDF